MQLVIAPPLPGHELDTGVKAGGALDGIFPPFGGTAFLNFGGGSDIPSLTRVAHSDSSGTKNSMEVKKDRDLQDGSDGRLDPPMTRGMGVCPNCWKARVGEHVVGPLGERLVVHALHELGEAIRPAAEGPLLGRPTRKQGLILRRD